MPPAETPLRVGVIHGPGARITPVWFDLNRRKHGVREVTNVWRDRLGEKLRIHFHVSDGGALYELVYDLDSQCWHLEQIEALNRIDLTGGSVAGQGGGRGVEGHADVHRRRAGSVEVLHLVAAVTEADPDVGCRLDDLTGPLVVEDLE